MLAFMFASSTSVMQSCRRLVGRLVVVKPRSQEFPYKQRLNNRHATPLRLEQYAPLLSDSDTALSIPAHA